MAGWLATSTYFKEIIQGFVEFRFSGFGDLTHVYLLFLWFGMQGFSFSNKLLWTEAWPKPGNPILIFQAPMLSRSWVLWDTWLGRFGERSESWNSAFGV